jgi:hypothetical protein
MIVTNDRRSYSCRPRAIRAPEFASAFSHTIHQPHDRARDEENVPDRKEHQRAYQTDDEREQLRQRRFRFRREKSESAFDKASQPGNKCQQTQQKTCP